MSEKDTKAKDPMTYEEEIQMWRRQGGRQKTFFLTTLAILAAGIIGLALLSTANAFPAQASQMPEQGREHRRGMQRGPDQELARMTKTLSLTDAQQAKIKPLLEEEHQQLTSVWKDSSMSRQDRRAKFMAIHSKTFDQIRPILTDAQQAKLQQMQQERRERMKAWREKGNPGSAPQSQ